MATMRGAPASPNDSARCSRPNSRSIRWRRALRRTRWRSPNSRRPGAPSIATRTLTPTPTNAARPNSTPAARNSSASPAHTARSTRTPSRGSWRQRAPTANTKPCLRRSPSPRPPRRARSTLRRRLRRSPRRRAATGWACIWTARASATRSRISVARRPTRHGAPASTSCPSGRRRTARWRPEAVIDFRPGAGATLARRRKRGGHLWRQDALPFGAA